MSVCTWRAVAIGIELHFVGLHYFEIELNIIVNWESHALTWCGIRCFGWKCFMEMCVECIVFKWHKRHGARSQSHKRHTTRSQWLLSVQYSGTVCGAMQSTTCRPNSKLISIWHDFQFQLIRYALSLEKTLE